MDMRYYNPEEDASKGEGKLRHTIRSQIQTREGEGG